MPQFIAIMNALTKESYIMQYHDWRIVNKSDLPCGLYKTYNRSVLFGMQCKTCNGTGIGEEVSGGHKKECDHCFGQGLDPVLLKEFEKSDPFQRWSWSLEWLAHVPKPERPSCTCMDLMHKFMCKRCKGACYEPGRREECENCLGSGMDTYNLDES